MIETAGIDLEQALALARDGATVVTAGQRLSRSLHLRYNAHAAGGGEVWPAPNILPWKAWTEELWQAALFSSDDALPALLNSTAGIALWERIITASPEAESLLEVSSTARAAADAWSLMQAWRIDRSAIEAVADDDARAFLSWAEEFESICARENWLDCSRLSDVLATRLPAIPHRLIIAGFDELTPQQSAFLEACRAAGSEVTEAAPSAGQRANARRAAYPGTAEEIAAAAQWSRVMLSSGATNVGVVIPSLERLRPLVERAFAQALDPGAVLPGFERQPALFNISASPSLASYPVIHAALHALSLEPDTNDLALVGRVLRSPFLRGGVAEWTGRAALDARLRRLGGTTVSITRVLRQSTTYDCPVLGSIFSAWRRERDQVPVRQTAPEWARTFSALLELLGWPGDRALSSDEYQCTQTWNELLSSFAALDLVLDAISFDDALARLRRMAAERPFQPESPAAPVQILGALETSGLTFDHLWVAGLDDESWPSVPKPAAFLPAILQRQRSLPHSSPAREMAFARMITERLLASAPDVVVSYATQDADRVLGPSSLIRDVPEDAPMIVHGLTCVDILHAASSLECIDDHTAPPLTGDAVRGGTSVFRYQAMCPFRAFAELRLGARPMEAPAPGLNPMERGTLAHAALAFLWTELKTHERLVELAPPELAERVRNAVAAAIGALGNRRGEQLTPRFTALEAVRLERILREWLEGEKLRAPFTVIHTEASREVGAGGVRCNVKVDRVDRLADGREILIDYKTGSPDTKSWEGDRPEEPQLPLYAVTHEGSLAAVVFGKLKTGNIGFTGYAAEEAVIPGAEVRELTVELAGWRRVLDRLGEDFRAGVAAVDPKNPAACQHCELAALCRFGDIETPTSILEGDTDA